MKQKEIELIGDVVCPVLSVLGAHVLIRWVGGNASPSSIQNYLGFGIIVGGLCMVFRRGYRTLFLSNKTERRGRDYFTEVMQEKTTEPPPHERMGTHERMESGREL